MLPIPQEPLASDPLVSPRTVSLARFGWLVIHFLFSLLILFCIPLWGGNNPHSTRPSYRNRCLIFSCWIIHNAFPVRLPHIQLSDIQCLPSVEDRTESSESSSSLDSEMDARFECLLPKASASFSLVYALPGNHPTLISPSAPLLLTGLFIFLCSPHPIPILPTAWVYPGTLLIFLALPVICLPIYLS